MHTLSRLMIISFFITLIIPQVTSASPFKIETVVSGLEHPWGMAFLPDGRMLVTERPGRLRIVEQGKLLAEPVKGLPPIEAIGQGGLLDIVLHPDYQKNGWLYFTYSEPEKGFLLSEYGTAVARAKLEGNTLKELQVIFSMNKKSSGGRHFGSRLVFDHNNYLYITVGERGERERSQDLNDHAGSVIRLHDDGRIPKDNPFLKIENARPEIYSYGHRNPQGMALHPQTGEVWLHEHGPQGGMAFYTGDAFKEWRGNLFVGSLKFQLLVRLELRDHKIINEEQLLKHQLGRIRDVRNGPDGLLYLLTDADDGAIVRLVPN